MAGVFCQICGRGDLLDLTRRLRARLDLHESADPAERRRAYLWKRMVGRLHVRCRRGTWTVRSLWEVDHIVPIAEGGRSDPWNLRALCRPCHKRETAKLLARIRQRQVVA